MSVMELGGKPLDDGGQVGIARVCLRHVHPVGKVRYLMMMMMMIMVMMMVMMMVTMTMIMMIIMMMMMMMMTSFKSGNLGTKSLPTQGEWRNRLRCVSCTTYHHNTRY